MNNQNSYLTYQMRNKVIAGVGLAACLGAWAASDPVVMTVNGVDVTKSEFEYLYHKNSQQQLSPQPLADYVEMFKIYKLKVADAKADGLDTTASFKKEMAQYRDDLSAPYMADSLFLNRLVKEAYDRAAEEVEARHIMTLKGRTPADVRKARAEIDSLHNLLLAGADFEQLARENSQDRTAKTNGGYLGYISAGKFPYSFEKAAFSLRPGELSEVVESPMGYHILKGGARRPSRGTVLAEHIMKMVAPGADAATEARAKQQIDSLYRLVKGAPASFEDVARGNSDDKGSARNGGQLPWFGAGEMVPEFDSVAFQIPVGSISEPVRSQYGWHIIKKLDTRGVPSLEEMKPALLERINNPQDERSRLVRNDRRDRLAKKHKGGLDKSTMARLGAMTATSGLDSVYYDAMRGELASLPVVVIGKTTVATAADLADYMRGYLQPDPEQAAKSLESAADNFLLRKLTDAEEDWLQANVADYRNLLNEYHDGSLLYEASVRKVWDKASKDTEGLDRYFRAHRSDYRWPEAHVKGILVQAVDDSVAAAVRERMSQVPSDSVLLTVRKEFSGKATAEKILLTKGVNPMVDNLMFGGPEVKPSLASYTTYFLFEPRLIDEPEEVSDVRGMVTSDYQNQLETEWVEELRKRYPVVVNEKAMKKVK